jgi:hypothetical protein
LIDDEPVARSDLLADMGREIGRAFDFEHVASPLSCGNRN